MLLKGYFVFEVSIVEESGGRSLYEGKEHSSVLDGCDVVDAILDLGKIAL